MYTKKQLKTYLEEIATGAKFTKFEYTTDEKFTVSLKSKIEEGEADFYNNYTKQWIRKFSEFTNTAWIVRNCFPNLKRLVYRKSFWCHRSAQNKSKTSERTRNLECKAKIDFRVKFINKNTLRNDPDLKEGLNMNIAIVFNHSHLVRAPESTNLLKSTFQSDSAFYEYFNDGYTASMAKCYHELLLIERYGQDSECLGNASVNPNLRHIIYLFQKKWKNKNIDTSHVIQRKTGTLEQNGFTIKYNSYPQFVVIFTPLMRRVVTQFHIDHLSVDVTSTGGAFIMIVYAPTLAGSIPIVSAIYTDQSEDVYCQIFLAISSVIESCKRFEPKIVSLSDVLVKNALISIFPNVIIKLDRYNICRELWEWISDTDNNIDKENCHYIMTMFRSLVYADSMADATNTYTDLLSKDAMQSYLHKLEYIWQDRERWIASEDFNANHIEAPIVFVKEFLMQKCKSFTFCVMVDVVTNILENHFQKMIIAYMKNEVMLLHTKFLPKASVSWDTIQRVGQHEFLIPCEFKHKNFYQLNTDSICCDCKIGMKGRICEHLTVILNSIDLKYIPNLTEDDKAMLFKIAGDVDKIKHEIDFEEINPEPDRHLSTSSNTSFSKETKKQEDPLYDNQHDASPNLKMEYETAMKAVNDEFRRLNKLFKDNPNRANMETMIRLARELSKIRPVETIDFSNMFVQLNT